MDEQKKVLATRWKNANATRIETFRAIVYLTAVYIHQKAEFYCARNALFAWTRWLLFVVYWPRKFLLHNGSNEGEIWWLALDMKRVAMHHVFLYYFSQVIATKQFFIVNVSYDSGFMFTPKIINYHNRKNCFGLQKCCWSEMHHNLARACFMANIMLISLLAPVSITATSH